jgi:hypothetical protein
VSLTVAVAPGDGRVVEIVEWPLSEHETAGRQTSARVVRDALAGLAARANTRKGT